MELPIVDYTILYNQKDISRDISEHIISIQYVDKVTGESDTLEITVQDSDQRWVNEWYPEKGDTLQLLIRNATQQLDCGVFQIDETGSTASTSGDVFSIRALAAGITKQLRTRKSYAHEDKSLREIANTIASEMGLSVLGSVPDIRIRRVNQYRETNLGFLNRIGEEYGCIFSVRADSLIFTHYEELEGRAASFSLTKQEIISWDLRDTTHKTFKKSKVKDHDPATKSTITYFTPDGEETNDPAVIDNIELRSKVDNKQQAEAKGKYALFKNNTKGVGGDITMPGKLLCVAGNNFQLAGAGRFSGVYHILESTHDITRDAAHQVTANVKRVKTVDQTLFRIQ